MRIKKIVCDKCGTEIKEKPFKVFIEQVDSESGDILEERCSLTDHLDFCKECKHEIVGYLCNAKATRVQEPEETPVQEPDEVETLVEKLEEPGEKYPAKTEAEKRNKLDISKIMALHKAGWGNKQIAEEFNTTPATISVAICNYKKKNHYPEGK